MRALLTIGALVWLSGVATCYFGVRSEVAKIPPAQRAQMTDTDWIGVEWVSRGMVIEAIGVILAATAIVRMRRAARDRRRSSASSL